MLEQWKAEWEGSAKKKADEKAKQDLYVLFDAATELHADITNW